MASNTVTFDRAAIEQLDSMFSKHTNELKALARSMQQRVGGGVLGGMGNGGPKPAASLTDAADELERFIKIITSNNKRMTQTEKYNVDAAKRELEATKKSIAEIEAERERRRALGERLEENADAQEDNTDKIKKSSGRLADFAEKVVGGTMSFTVLTRAINEFSQAYKQGFNWNAMSDTINAALQMGMSPKDMMDFQKRFRTVSNTFEGGISQFNDVIGASTNEWKFFTGSLKDAAIAQGEFYQLALSMGVGAKDMKGAVGGMFQEFKKLQVATSMTAEEFVATQKSLMAEQVVRSKLVGLQGKERSNYMLKLTDTAYMFQTLGLQKEAAESLVKALEQQSGKTGVNRLVEGSQMNALAGILGMGESGARLRQLNMKKNRTTDENAEYTQLAAEMSKRIEAKRNKGGVDEYQIDALQAQFGGAFDTISKIGEANALSSGAAANPAAIAKQQLDIANRDSGVYGEIKDKITLIADILGGWSQSALAALVAFGVGKGALAGSKAWLGRRGGAGGPGGARNPDFIGPPNPNGPGGGPGAASKWATRGAAVAKTGLYAAIIGTAASAAVGAFVKDEKTKSILDSGITGASLGATVGALGGPIGIAIGTALGGVGGIIVGMVQNQETIEGSLAKQKKQLVDQTSMDEIRYRMSKEQYEKELEALGKKDVLNQKDLDRQTELQRLMQENDKEFTANKAKVAAGEFGYQLGAQKTTSDWMTQSASDIKRGGFFSDTSSGDVKQMLAQLQSKLSAAGMEMTPEQLNAQFGGILKSVAMTRSGADRDQGFAAAANLGEGKDIEYVAKVANPMIAEAMTQLSTQLQGGFQAQNQASFASKLTTPDAVLGIAEQVKATQAQIQKDKADLAATNMMPDEYGFASSQAADIQKRIDNSQATLDALQKLVANSGQVTFKSEDKLVTVLEDLAKKLSSSNPPPPIHQ